MTIKQLDQDNFHHAITAADLPQLIEFTAPWCVFCRRLSPALQQLSAESEGKIQVAQVDIDKAAELAEAYGVSVIPTLLLFKEGRHGEALVAPASLPQIKQWLNRQLPN